MPNNNNNNNKSADEEPNLYPFKLLILTSCFSRQALCSRGRKHQSGNVSCKQC